MILVPVIGTLVYAGVTFARQGHGHISDEGLEQLREAGVVTGEYQPPHRLAPYTRVRATGE